MHELASRKPLRLWPGVVGALLLLVFWYGLPVVMPEATLVGMAVGAVGFLVIAVWWIFFSRAPWSERVGAIILMVVAVFATSRFVHESIAGGMMGRMLPVYSIPVLSVALVGWAIVANRLPDGVRRMSLVAAILLACVPFTLLRTAGIWGAGAQFHWRWTETPEQRLLAQATDDAPDTAGAEPKAPPPSPTTGGAPEAGPAAKSGDKPASLPAAPPASPTIAAPPSDPDARADWPGFRGPERDGIVRGVRIRTDWSQTPPVEMWRRPIGPGWSSFAVVGDLLYTQEQRGDDEIVSCYRVSTGKPVWRHRDAARFWESNGGAGPRGTPTLSNGRVYAFGATGILNALDASSGAVVWSRNVASDADKQVPMWGFASSPLVQGDVVIVAASGKLVAYDIATGKPRWFGPARPGSYSSPHQSTIGGVPQILLLTGAGAISIAPADGTVLWEHAWGDGTPIVQPALTADGDVLINAAGGTGGVGIRRLSVAHGAGGWTVQERWTSRGLKPYFNDFVVHKGHAFGFDGSILSSIDLETGNRKWKGGRYGDGQMMLLSEQDVLLLVSEEGELALVEASPDQFKELARFKAIEGKTWNHPVLVGDVLLVRNGEEMAAFRLSLAR